MQGLDRLNVGWSTCPVVYAENWRGAPDLGPRISEGEGPPAHRQSLLQGLPPSFVHLVSWPGRLMLDMGKARHLTDQVRRIARQGGPKDLCASGAALATEALPFPLAAVLFSLLLEVSTLAWGK